jgi:ABC-2 type transport system permease protein
MGVLPNVLLKTLRDSRRSLAWWSVGLCGLVSMTVAVFPSVRGNPSLNKLVQDYPEALKAFISFGGSVDYTSAAGYLGSELFSFMVPLLLMVAAIGAGARAIAGEEEQGTLDLLLANPISRRRLVVEKLGALVVEIAFLGAVLWVALAIGTRLAGMHIGRANLAAATLDATLLALLFGVLALLVGSAVGRRGLALAVSAAAAVAAYLVNALAAIVGALEPVRKLSPFYHYVAGDPLRHGLALDHTAVLVLVVAALAVAIPLAFDRRDLT